jgi:(E)-4-hydroxy-3-methyl-but-2-enyl pyrophosphate reductase
MHNSQEVQRLSEKGLIVKKHIQDCVGGKTLVRTHGISREELLLADKFGIELVDAICPYVKVPRDNIEKFGLQGRTVFLVGDRGHPEVKALLSWAIGPVMVISSLSEIPALAPDTPIGLVAQTTQSEAFFTTVVSRIKERYQDTLAANTICKDAEIRQESGRRLSRQVGMMLVVGGRNSANTCRIAEICKAIQPNTIHVETAEGLKNVSLDGIESVGLVSGASTPDWIIQEVESWITCVSSRPLI